MMDTDKVSEMINLCSELNGWLLEKILTLVAVKASTLIGLN
jgi:hypothetical protein